jgi:DNA transformation protein
MADGASIADLPGLGPKSRQMLAQAGIHGIADLQALGAVAAYVRTKRAASGVSLNLLWGLESALTGLPWQQVAREQRTSLLLALEDYERRHPAR